MMSQWQMVPALTVIPVCRACAVDTSFLRLKGRALIVGEFRLVHGEQLGQGHGLIAAEMPGWYGRPQHKGTTSLLTEPRKHVYVS
jgi:hypothetical protein